MSTKELRSRNLLEGEVLIQEECSGRLEKGCCHLVLCLVLPRTTAVWKSFSLLSLAENFSPRLAIVTVRLHG